MIKSLKSFVDEVEIPYLLDFLFTLQKDPPAIFLNNEVLLSFQKFVDSGRDMAEMDTSWRFLRKIQEILLIDDKLILVFRHRRASCRIYRLSRDEFGLETVGVKDFLVLKERLILPQLPFDHRSMKINMEPFYDYGPILRDPDTIGNGIRHLNQYMSTKLSSQPEKWNRELYEFLKLHHLHGMQLLLDGNMIKNTEELESALEDASDFLERCNCKGNLDKVKDTLKSLGLLEGWGNTPDRILETIQLLQDVLEQPNSDVLEEFLARIPMVSKVALISPHGWFGQQNVLGRPDTGGQVVYILDQARALEQYLAKDLDQSGMKIDPKILIVTRLIPENEGTTSDVRLEKVEDANNVWILRVPFRDHHGEVIPHWISRFRIWPYLDQFAVEAENEILAELNGLPDLLVGNYSDGNLVAAQLSKSLGVIQCNIAHALEKSKYLFSDLYWQNFEQDYHFSVQFMADLISMNLANFIVTSSRQEITGTTDAIGQYESYQFFTMPGLLHVVSGVNLFHPRLNVIPPGVNNKIFFPYTQKSKRNKNNIKRLETLLFENDDQDCCGRLKNPELPPIFSIARLDRIKNLTGLVEAYGKSETLREQANLIVTASTIDQSKSNDAEEAAEIGKMHSLLQQYELYDNVRWIGKRLDKEDTGEIYRIIADRRGIFIQPALFEAFGLTILEAMHSALPVFATQFGGPAEIIESGKNGFLINPTDQEAMTAMISEFFLQCGRDDKYWRMMSKKSLDRARAKYTWELHCKQLTRLTKVYGFWRYSISNEAKRRMAQYCHLLYELFFKVRAEGLRHRP